jgi:ferritin-like metal-binding protein YciE
MLERAAFSPTLAGTLRSHIQQSRDHAQRLERILNSGSAPESGVASSIAGLLQSCLDLSRDSEAAPDVCDAALIAALQRVEHDQITGYGCARTWAQVLGDNDAGAVLQKCLTDEKDCDAELSRVAEQTNRRAAYALALA